MASSPWHTLCSAARNGARWVRSPLAGYPAGPVLLVVAEAMVVVHLDRVQLDEADAELLTSTARLAVERNLASPLARQVAALLTSCSKHSFLTSAAALPARTSAAYRALADAMRSCAKRAAPDGTGRAEVEAAARLLEHHCVEARRAMGGSRLVDPHQYAPQVHEAHEALCNAEGGIARVGVDALATLVRIAQFLAEDFERLLLIGDAAVRIARGTACAEDINAIRGADSEDAAERAASLGELAASQRLRQAMGMAVVSDEDLAALYIATRSAGRTWAFGSASASSPTCVVASTHTGQMA